VTGFLGAVEGLRRSERNVTAAAGRSVAAGAADGAAAVRTSRAPYPYRYAERIAAAVKSPPPRETRGGNIVTATVKIGGRARVFSGGASVSDLVWGAEFGAKGGDVVRVKLSTGTSRSVSARNFHAYRRRAESGYTIIKGYTKAGQARRRTVSANVTGAQRTRITGARAGGLTQFPARRRDGWFLTPAFDQAERELWQTTDALFRDALKRER
jgi:hypothetical protein